MASNLPSSLETHAIIVAAGKGERSGLGRPKQFQPINGKPMVRYSAEQFLTHNRVASLWIVIGSGQEEMLTEAMDGLEGYHPVIGGDSRQQSVLNGLLAIENYGGCNHVLIHDAARPFLDHSMIELLCNSLEKNTGAIPVLPVVDTIVETQSGQYGRALNRDRLKHVQTPQAFHFGLLLEAHRSQNAVTNASDDAQLLQALGHNVSIVEGDEKLKKYTTAADFANLSDQIVVRTGIGYDVHRLGAGEELWLGGIKIEHEKGLIGHSDADVLLHALTDALLGAIGEGDIGDHFPPSDAKWKNANSGQFVKFACQFIKDKGGTINNVDMTLMCEAPKIKPHREAICRSIANLLSLSLDQVSVKATTTEGLGFAGRREGIAAQAIATVSMKGIEK